MLGGNHQLRLPSWGGERTSHIVDYVALVQRMLQDKVQSIVQSYIMRKECAASFLSVFGQSVLEYDTEDFKMLAFLFELQGFSFIARCMCVCLYDRCHLHLFCVWEPKSWDDAGAYVLRQLRIWSRTNNYSFPTVRLRCVTLHRIVNQFFYLLFFYIPPFTPTHTVSFSDSFPQEKPTLFLQSVYHRLHHMPCQSEINDYPYSPRWSVDELVDRMRYRT